MAEPLESLVFPDSELVLGLVAPVGADLNQFQQAVKDRLDQFRYQSHVIRLSSLLKTLTLETELKENNETDRLESFMSAGNEARDGAKRGDFLALLAAHRIGELRNHQSPALGRHAHILRSLNTLRKSRPCAGSMGPVFF